MVILKKISVLFLIFVLGIQSFISPSYIYALGAPTKISTSTTNDVIFPQTTTDSKGFLHMVWQELTPNQIWTGLNPGIFYSRWNGDTWSAPLKISENTGFAEIPGIAADTTDTIHVVWDDETYGSGLSKVAYKTRTAGGTWSAIETLPTPTGTGYNWNARVALDATNTPHVVFAGIRTNLTGTTNYWTRKVSGAWTTPEIIAKNTSGNDILSGCEWSDLRQEANGDIHLIYWCSLDPDKGIFYREYTGGAWSTPVLITSARDIEFTRMAVTPGGQVFVTWFEAEDSTVHVRWTVSGVWQSELDPPLAAAGDRSFWGFPIMGVTTDSKERAHVGWGEKDAGNLIDLRYRSFVPGSGWQAVQDVDLDNNDADTPFVYPDKWDNQHFAWAETNPVSGLWELMYRVAEGTIKSVGTAGDTITVNPGNVTYVTLAIPASALSVNTQIGIQIGPVPESVNPTQVTIPRSFTFRPNGLVFNVPKKATATITYTDAEVAGSDERLLQPWVWDSLTNLWVTQVGQNNTNQNTIKVDLLHFSLYGISAPLVNTNFLTPSQNQTIKQAALLFEFNLNYADGTEVVEPVLPDELTVKVKNASGLVVKTLSFEPSGVIKDQGKKIYKGVLQFQKDNYQNGEYAIEVYLADSLVGMQMFTLAR